MITNRRTNIISDRRTEINNRTFKNIKLKPFFLQYIDENFREFVVGIIMILLGIIVSIMFVNNTNEEQKKEITAYIQNYILNLKERKIYK